MAVTDPDADPHRRATQIVVPADTPGVEIVRAIPTMGHRGRGWTTHCEVRYTGVRVPSRTRSARRATASASRRSGSGRAASITSCAGSARCSAPSSSCARYALERESFGGPLAEKQTVQNWIADSAAEIQACRLMTLDAAHKIDQGDEARVEVSLIKFYAARVLHDVIDRAVQTHGARGLTDETPLAGMLALARGARIYDGPDEVHRMVVARRILKSFAAGEAGASTEPRGSEPGATRAGIARRRCRPSPRCRRRARDAAAIARRHLRRADSRLRHADRSGRRHRLRSCGRHVPRRSGKRLYVPSARDVGCTRGRRLRRGARARRHPVRGRWPRRLRSCRTTRRGDASRRSRTPVPGNHDYHTPGAEGYYDYFGKAAGDPTKGYYSFDLGGWHLVALNSNCAAVGGCGAGSPQEKWLRADLAAHPARVHACVLASPALLLRPPRQRPRVHGVLAGALRRERRRRPRRTRPRLRALRPAGSERRLDLARGLRQFVVGTGGKNLRGFLGSRPNSEARDRSSFGVLELTLGAGAYAWRFRPASARSRTAARRAATDASAGPGRP